MPAKKITSRDMIAKKLNAKKSTTSISSKIAEADHDDPVWQQACHTYLSVVKKIKDLEDSGSDVSENDAPMPDFIDDDEFQEGYYGGDSMISNDGMMVDYCQKKLTQSSYDTQTTIDTYLDGGAIHSYDIHDIDSRSSFKNPMITSHAPHNSMLDNNHGHNPDNTVSLKIADTHRNSSSSDSSSTSDDTSSSSSVQDTNHDNDIEIKISKSSDKE